VHLNWPWSLLIFSNLHSDKANSHTHGNKHTSHPSLRRGTVINPETIALFHLPQ
jgi:hypothetical protein